MSRSLSVCYLLRTSQMLRCSLSVARRRLCGGATQKVSNYMVAAATAKPAALGLQAGDATLFRRRPVSRYSPARFSLTTSRVASSSVAAPKGEELSLCVPGCFLALFVLPRPRMIIIMFGRCPHCSTLWRWTFGRMLVFDRPPPSARPLTLLTPPTQTGQ